MPLPNRSTAATYDAVNKINSQTVPPANQATDWDNSKLGPAISDVVALGLTGCRFWCRLTLAATTGALSIPVWEANWANVTATSPIPGRTTTGEFTITLPTVVSDEYDASLGNINTILLNLSAAQGGLEGTTPGFINCSASGNVISINTFNAGGSANDLVGITCLIVAR